MNTNQQGSTNSGQGLGLLAILVGIVLGVCFGLTYGRAMWLASDGPEEEIEKLEKTIAQKENFAQDAEAENKPEEAERLRSHVPEIRKKIEDIRALQRFLFRIDPSHQGNLDDGTLSERLRQGFQQHDISLAANVSVTTEEPAKRWRISDKNQTYTVRRIDKASLGIYSEKVLPPKSLPLYTSKIVRFCGDIFLRMLLLIVIPLVVTSMICGITSLGDVRRLGKVGGWTLFYYFSTGAAAVTVGILLVVIIEPGKGADDTFAYVSEEVRDRQETSALDTLLEVVLGPEDEEGKGMVPSNIFLAASETNVLALILFAIVFGGVLSTLGEKGKPAVDFFHAANEAVMKVVHLIILFAPVGIFGLIATKIADSGGGGAFGDEVARLAWYVATVMLGLAIHLVVLCLVLLIFTRRNPLRYLYVTARALLTAMSTASSSATLPVTMECVDGEGVSERAAGFVLPLGATINMDGTALYEAVAAIFIAQSMGIELSGAALVIVFLTATLAAVGAPGIPEAGLVTLLIVLTAVGLPAAGIGTILAIDWFLDRQRTAVNVFGDAVGAAVIDRYLNRLSAKNQ